MAEVGFLENGKKSIRKQIMVNNTGIMGIYSLSHFYDQ